MIYSVVVTPGAAHEIRKLPRQVSVEIGRVIDGLALDPRPLGVKKIEGIRDCYRVRKGVYRIVYTIEDNILKVDVVTVGHRKEVYQNLDQKVRRRAP